MEILGFIGIVAVFGAVAYMAYFMSKSHDIKHSHKL